MKKRYRISEDDYNGFEVQESFLHFFWFQSKGIDTIVNSFSTIYDAKNHIQYLKKLRTRIVYTE